MKCHNCDKEITVEDIKFCPYCGTSLDEPQEEKSETQILDEELALLDTKEFIMDFGKTQSINSLEKTKELDKLSLIDDINAQIDEINEEKLNEDGNPLNIIKEKIEKKLPTEEDDKEFASTQKTRKKILLVSGICTLCIILISILILSIYPNLKKDNNDYDYMKELNIGLKDLYDKERTTKLVSVLSYIKDDEEKIDKVQEKTNEECEKWVDIFIETETKNSDEFESLVDENIDRIELVYSLTNEQGIHLLNDKNYKDLIKEIKAISTDSKSFYEALEYYNKKSYNESYYMFDKVDKDNPLYQKSKSYQNKIITEVLKLLDEDIKKIESTIDSNDTDESVLKKYNSIDSIIQKYNTTYHYLDLASNSSYQNKYNKYQDLIDEYNEKIMKEKTPVEPSQPQEENEPTTQPDNSNQTPDSNNNVDNTLNQ